MHSCFGAPNWRNMEGYRRTECVHCEGELIWKDDVIVLPNVLSGPEPNEDLNDDIKADYQEARSIAVKSPRGAAALLRLCLQKLCAQLGQPGKDINKDIAALVKTGLPVDIQRALDVVRVVGNQAVHPGELDIKDDIETVGALFELLNAIADDMLTQPKKREALFARLPQGARDAIAKRDGKP